MSLYKELIVSKLVSIGEYSNLLLSILLIALGTAFLIAVGLFGFMKPGTALESDFIVFYNAATLFLSGANPWSELASSATPYSYPPHSVAVLTFLGVGSVSVALILQHLINLSSILLIVMLSNNWFLHVRCFSSMTFAQALCICILLGNPYMATSVNQGQLTLPAVALIMLCWHMVYYKNTSTFISGICLAFATIKPQLSLLFVIWFLIDKKFMVVLWGGAISFMLMLPGFINLGLYDTLFSWLGSMGGYSNVHQNAMGSPYVVGIQSMMVAYGVDIPAGMYLFLAGVSVGLLYLKKNSLSFFEIFSFLYIASFLFIYGHDYDYVAIAPVMVGLLMVALKFVSLRYTLLYFLAFLIFFMPQRGLRQLDVVLLDHVRTLILMGVALMLIYYKDSVCKTLALFQNSYGPK